MIYLKLFLTFLEIGTVSFGGGYGMISLIREKALLNGWLTQEELLNFIAVAESTPGPIAVNMATFVGSSQGGFFGSIAATAGVVLPSFIIILIIVSLMKNLLKYKPVSAFLLGVRPCVVGLIFATALTMLGAKLTGISVITDKPDIDVYGIMILILLLILAYIYKKITSKKLSPVLMIVISAGLGMIFYSIKG